ncbi:MAG: RHS repeat-associated core domain-containing protein [Myxococcales bacterium]
MAAPPPAPPPATYAKIPLEPVGFTGKEADEEVGLTYFGERYLVQRLGRWASPDPLSVHAAGGGEALNAYHYVSGNLLQARDPLGLQEAIPGEALREAFQGAAEGNGAQSAWESTEAPAWAPEDMRGAKFEWRKQRDSSVSDEVFWYRQVGADCARCSGGSSEWMRWGQTESGQTASDPVDVVDLVEAALSVGTSFLARKVFGTMERKAASLAARTVSQAVEPADDTARVALRELDEVAGSEFLDDALRIPASSKVEVKPGKWDYFFGRVKSNVHNRESIHSERSRFEATWFRRIRWWTRRIDGVVRLWSKSSGKRDKNIRVRNHDNPKGERRRGWSH